MELTQIRHFIAVAETGSFTKGAQRATVMAPHRRVASEILRGKLWPPHLHHWIPLVFDLSRLVHDLLDTARVPGEGTLRALQEIGLTLVLLATLRDWARDRSEAQAWTKRRLRRRLAQARLK
jgi:hypothetical protein